MADNIESRMSFIIEQQAQFTVDIQLLQERQADSQRQIDVNREMIRKLVDVTMSLARHAEATDRRLGELGARTEERFRELAEAGTHTDRRLDALIDTVDKLVRRNGS
jgi:predicted  nucleic acid-binding Zn-ribbon protein